MLLLWAPHQWLGSRSRHRFRRLTLQKGSTFVSTDAAAQTASSHSLFWPEFRGRFRFRLAILRAGLLTWLRTHRGQLALHTDAVPLQACAGVWIRAADISGFPHILTPHPCENKAIAFTATPHVYQLFVHLSSYQCRGLNISLNMQMLLFYHLSFTHLLCWNWSTLP